MGPHHVAPLGKHRKRPGQTHLRCAYALQRRVSTAWKPLRNPRFRRSEGFPQGESGGAGGTQTQSVTHLTCGNATEANIHILVQPPRSPATALRCGKYRTDRERPLSEQRTVACRAHVRLSRHGRHAFPPRGEHLSSPVPEPGRQHVTSGDGSGLRPVSRDTLMPRFANGPDTLPPRDGIRRSRDHGRGLRVRRARLVAALPSGPPPPRQSRCPREAPCDRDGPPSHTPRGRWLRRHDAALAG